MRTRKNVRCAVDKLIEKRNKLKDKLKVNHITNEGGNILRKIEEYIAEVIALEGGKRHELQKHSAQNGSVSLGDMWRFKKKVLPKTKKPYKLEN